MDWVKRGFSFSDKISRGQFFLYYLASFGLAWAGLAVSIVSSQVVWTPLNFAFILAIIGSVWITLAAFVKRFRDAGISYWLFLLTVVPFGAVALFMLALAVPTKGRTEAGYN